MSYDIVYILKEGIDSEELRYSLRSVCENFDYNKIWFYCGCPKDIKPDKYVPFKQKGYNKLDRVHSTFKAICENDEITSDFYLFNDDFFIMQPYEQETPLCNGTLKRIAYLVEQNSNIESFYAQYLKYTHQILEEKHYDTLSYEVHGPILINRKRALEVLKEFPGNTQFRSTYGNYCLIGGVFIQDPKIEEIDVMPNNNSILLSTVEESFANGLVGAFIRNAFPVPCRYEIEKTGKWKKILSKKKTDEDINVIKNQKQVSNYSTNKFYLFLKRIKKEYFTFPYEE